MAIWKKTALGIGTATLAALGAGYATAWLSLTPCADETFQEIQRNGTSGRDIRGNRVVLTRHAVTARITGPFLVETRYIVPYDLHGSFQFKRYLVLPWGRYERSSDTIQLVSTPAPSSQLSANNSFKPTPLRGAA